MATITVTGNLTSDPDLRFTHSGRGVVSFGLADNHYRRGTSGEWEQTGTTFYEVIRWAGPTSTAEVDAIAESLSKGARVIVTGRVQSRTWTGNDGHPRTSLEITADEIGASLRGARVSIDRPDRDTTAAGDGRAPLAAVPEPADSEPPF